MSPVCLKCNSTLASNPNCGLCSIARDRPVQNRHQAKYAALTSINADLVVQNKKLKRELLAHRQALRELQDSYEKIADVWDLHHDMDCNIRISDEIASILKTEDPSLALKRIKTLVRFYQTLSAYPSLHMGGVFIQAFHEIASEGFAETV